MSEAQRRHWLVWTVVGVLVAVALVVGAPWVYARFIAREAPDPLALSTPTTSAEAQIPTGRLEIDGTWSVGEGSEAGYRLGEVLSGQQTTVVGRTEGVTGTVVVNGGMLDEATIVVDAGPISTDAGARDAYFRRALDTSSFPEARFELTEPVDISALGQADVPLSVTAVGTLTLHGVPQPATAVLDVQRTAGGVEVASQIPITLTDFGLTAPDLGWVVVESTGAIEVRLVLGR